MKDKLRVGVVGCGQIAQIMHLPYLKELPFLEIGAVCDISKMQIDAIGDFYGVKNRYLDYQDMLAQDDLDIVLICNMDHAQVAIDAATAGKHVITEKPMCFNLEEADRMIEAAKKSDVKLMVSYMKRYDPGYQWALPMLKSMKDLRYIQVRDFGGDFSINNEIYDLFVPTDIPEKVMKEGQAKMQAALVKAVGKDREELSRAYSLLLGLSTHDSVVMRQAFGYPDRVLYADVYEKTFVVAVLEYGSGARCGFESGLLMGGKWWEENLTAFGTDRVVEVKFPFPYLRNAATLVNVKEMDGGAIVSKEVVASYDEAFKREWRHFYECITEDREPLTNGEEGRADIALMIDIIKAVRV